MAVPGGMSNVREADAEVQAICDKVKSEVESKAGQPYNRFVAVQYATQVVAGVNYFVKIDVGDGKYIHVRIYQDLQRQLSVHSVQTDKSKDDPLNYF